MLELRSYSEFSRNIHESVNARRIPVNGTIEVTNRCPLTCAHCYNNLAMNDSSARSRELSTDEHRRIADEIAEMGCLWLLYSGGEIFARRDFLDIYIHAKRTGLLITLFTNAVLVSEKIADLLAEWTPFAIEVTLYGRTRETYEALTGIPGSFDKCIRGIELMRERKLPLKLKTVAVTINKHEVSAMKQFAADLGCEFKFDPMINPRIDCSSSPLAVRLSPSEIVSLDLEDPQRVAEWQRMATTFAPLPPPEGEAAEIYDCGAGVNSFAIDPYGKLTMCVLSHVDSFDLKRGSFREGWEHFLRGVRSKRATMPTKCTRCAIRSMCGMCPAEGELENGDPEKPVDFLCSVAHLRARAFNIAVPEHGDCEYCEDGENHALIESMLDAVGGPIEAATIPLISSSPSCGGGCTSCTIR